MNIVKKGCIVKCDKCGVDIYRTNHDLKRNKRNFCSLKCLHMKPWQKGLTKYTSEKIKIAGLKTSFTKRKQYDLSVRDCFEFGYIIGVLFGDGFLTKYSIGLEAKDDDFIKFFKIIFERYYKINGHIYKFEGRMSKSPNGIVYSCKPTSRVSFNSVIISSFLRKFKKQIDLKFIENKSYDFKKGMLKGLFDSEGCLYYRKRIWFESYLSFTNKSTFLHQMFSYLAKDLMNINTRFEEKRNGINRTIIGKNDDVQKFVDIIGVTIRRKIDSKFKFNLQ